jgi:hypothetical protein
MAEMKLCDACSMEFDWKGVEARGYEYCCEACSRGEECTCPQHRHEYQTDQPMHRAAAEQLGLKETR